MSRRTWLIDLEVRAQVVNFDNTQITFLNNSAMRDCALLQEKNAQTEIQANANDTVHNHAPILPTLSSRPKE